MKTTLEIPDELFRQTKATAALRGESMKEFVTEAIRNRLAREATGPTALSGWRSVFGKASAEQVAEVDARIAEEVEHVDLESWR